ncbi:ATP-binding protein [Spirillospora sp. NPDC029432]|uniref:ATP-binding protein n=1 Tax=Spirillospora sp. NPDC029432 TaxID=3154599 RepID=UPI0034525CBB
MTTEPLAEILADWPGRWRYPRLVKALTEGAPMDDSEAARFLLGGLADPVSAAGGIERLIAEGEFQLVDEMLTRQAERGSADGEITGDGLRRLQQALAEARRTARGDAERERATLAERARRAGLDPDPLAGLADHAQLSRTGARELLDQEIERIAKAEKAIAKDLAGRLHTASSEAHRAAVEGCIGAGEFPTARRLLEIGRIDMDTGGPSSVPRPPLWDPSMGDTLEEILLRYPPDAQEALRPHQVRYADVGDTGAEVVEALRHLAAHLDEPNVATFATALGRMLGEDVRPSVEARDGGFQTRLLGLDDARLPGLLVTRRTGVTLWVAGAGAPPPGDLERPLVWFVPASVPVDGRRPPGTAVLSATDLLCLLARLEQGAPANSPSRRVNLLRAIVPQLIAPPAGLAGITDAETGVDLNSGASPRESLAWLLDLCGVTADAVVVDTLEYETGSHPRAAGVLLNRLLAEPPAGHRLTLTELNAVRNRETRDLIREELTAPLGAEERAVLGIAYTLHQDAPFAPGDLLNDVPLIGLGEEDTARAVQNLAPEAVLPRLTHLALLRDHADGYMTLPSGLGELLAEGAESLAATALRELVERADDAHATMMAALTDQALVRVGHRSDNIVMGVTELLDELERETDPAARARLMERIRESVGQLGGDRQRSALDDLKRPPEDCDLADLMRRLGRGVEWREGVEVSFHCTGGAFPIHAVRALLELAFENLLINAVQAMRKAKVPAALQEIAVRVREAERDGPGGRPGPWSVVDIEDAGPGLTADELSILARGDTFTKHGSGGTGIKETRETVRRYGGAIEFLPRSETLGGAHLRVWLPRS